MHTKQVPVIVPIQHPNWSVLEINQNLQKIMQKEEKLYFDEKSVVALDGQVRQKVDSLLIKMIEFSLMQK